MTHGTISLDDNDVFICKIPDVPADQALTDEARGAEERMALTGPVIWMGAGIGHYFTANSDSVSWTGDWKNLYGQEKG